MKAEEIIKKLHFYIIQLIDSLPDEIVNKAGDLWFVFDENSLCYKNKLRVFASHEPVLRTITFYISTIISEDFTDLRLKQLVQHEYAHAIGMNENQVAEMMEKKYVKI